MIRILHTADWHLGQTLAGFDRSAEHEAALRQLLDWIVSRDVDALIVAGDVFHTANPPVAAQHMLFRFLREIAEAAPRTDVIVIAGNHDSGSRLELPAALAAPQIRIYGAPGRRHGGVDPEATLAPLTNARGEVAAIAAALPYPRPGDLADFGPGATGEGASPKASQGASEGASQAPPIAERGDARRPVKAFLCSAAAAAARRWPGAPLVVVTHLHVTGGLGGGEEERPILIGGEPSIPLSDFPPGAAYVALGHLHRPQTLQGAPRAVYAGPPIPLSNDEAAHVQSAALVEISPRDARDADGVHLEIERLPFQRTRGFLRAPERGAAPPAALETILRNLAARVREDPEARAAPPFLEVCVALDAPEPDLRRKVDLALADAPVRLTRIRRERPAAQKKAAEDGADAPRAG
ncbi:MAG: exonuclease SbcCD subunit D C-terminal domain-containing protein, partial [Pseudomonadota bacterium]